MWFVRDQTKEPFMHRIVLAFAVVLVVAGQASAQKEAPAAKPSEVVLATVNGTTITMRDFQEAVAAMPPQQQVLALTRPAEFLDSLVKRELVFQEAMRRRLDSDPDVASLVAKLKKEVVITTLLRRVIQKADAVTDEEAERYYLENKDRFRTPEKITASHIVLKTEEEAKDVLAALRNGKDFTTLAKERSSGPRASQGGYLGSITRGEMPIEFDRAAFNLQVGSVSEVVKTPFGFHIIKVTDNVPSTQMGYSDVSDQIQQRLQVERQQAAVQAFLEEVTTKASVETFPGRLAGREP
ncbi:MAG: peptidylprolyl isomerase [bacterium]|nr:peptidylprolyl isomerase [bacterium]